MAGGLCFLRQLHLASGGEVRADRIGSIRRGQIVCVHRAFRLHFDPLPSLINLDPTSDIDRLRLFGRGTLSWYLSEISWLLRVRGHAGDDQKREKSLPHPYQLSTSHAT